MKVRLLRRSIQILKVKEKYFPPDFEEKRTKKIKNSVSNQKKCQNWTFSVKRRRKTFNLINSNFLLIKIPGETTGTRRTYLQIHFLFQKESFFKIKKVSQGNSWKSLLK